MDRHLRLSSLPTSHLVASLNIDSTPSAPVPNSQHQGKLKRETLVLAYKTLGVVFGGLVTSPLYVYPSMPLKSPTEDDYLGIYSIMFWTLTLIGVVKYASIAIQADDQGEGGTFALYSLLCRHLNIGILPSKQVNLNSSTNGATETQSWLGKLFERSIIARRVLLFIAMLGTCMLIGDGILTPAISVLSAMDGLRAPFPSVSKSLVVALSAVVLVFLFLLQKFGTSRVSFLFSPIMGAWTLSTPLIGIYSIIRHYPSIFKALSPQYIFRFFWRNGKSGWLLLGGTVLCITGMYPIAQYTIIDIKVRKLSLKCQIRWLAFFFDNWFSKKVTSKKVTSKKEASKKVASKKVACIIVKEGGFKEGGLVEDECGKW